MSQDATLRTLLVELMASYDSTISTEVGSAFDTKVMSPFLTRIGGSPLDVDFEAFAVERLQTEIPELDTSEFSGIRDLLIRAGAVLLAPIRREISAIKLAQSLNNVASLTRDEVNARLANFFMSLRDGTAASGLVRMYFLSPQSIAVTPLTRFSSGGGLNFFPSFVQSISQELMAFNLEGQLYYFDVLVTAEDSGEQYNVAARAINSVQGVVGVVRVSNLTALSTPGTATETKEEGVARAEESITLRTLSVERGIEFVLKEAFPSIDSLQVVSKGDAEMDRDLVVGPVTISQIPGGFIGDKTPTIGAGQVIHIGGKTDIYVYQPTLVEDALDIENIENAGVRIYAGISGFTEAGDPTSTFFDLYGQFILNGVLPGDYIRVGAVERQILSVTTTSLTVSGTFNGGLFDQDYDIVRKSTSLIQIPLYDLVAIENGVGAVDVDGDPAQPIPGDLDLAPLLVSGARVKKTLNIASNNLNLPVTRIASVEFLDPLTLESSGTTIPMKDLLLVKNPTAFTGGLIGFRATGTLRLYFRDPVSAWVRYDLTRFVAGTVSFRPIAETTGTARVASIGSTLTLEGTNYTSQLRAGDRITYRGEIRTVVSFSFASPNTLFVVREPFTATATSATFTLHKGIAEAQMPQDPDTRLFYFDVSVESVLTGSQGNLPADTTLDATFVESEGWSLKTTKSVLSFSDKELPYLELTQYVNDSENLKDPGTAYAIRLNYSYAPVVAQVQTFLEDPKNRVVGEEPLAKFFLPVYVRGQFGVDTNEVLAKETIEDFLVNLDPTKDLEISDLINALYTVGVTKVDLPITVVGLFQDSNRRWRAEISQNTLESTRIQHFLPESGEIITEA